MHNQNQKTLPGDIRNENKVHISIGDETNCASLVSLLSSWAEYGQRKTPAYIALHAGTVEPYRVAQP